MIEIQYCEDCKHIIDNGQAEATCQASVYPDPVHRSEPTYWLCHILRSQHPETCPEFEAKE